MEKINFRDCTLANLDKRFGTRRVDRLAHLEEWVGGYSGEIQSSLLDVTQLLSATLRRNGTNWNEQDLSMHFIGPIFSLVNFTEPYRFNLFAQRSIEAVIKDDIMLTGRVDETVAVGYDEPEKPFFAFNEYKRQTDPNGDPAGQALGAMLVGQQLNNDGKAIYGCYIIGRNWTFMLLEGDKYAMSDMYDGGNYEDACQILRILFQLKVYCMERTAHLVVD